jgi:hypothetical protein
MIGDVTTMNGALPSMHISRFSLAIVMSALLLLVAPGAQGYDGGTFSAGNTHSCLVANGSAQCWGSNSFGQLGTGNHLPSGTPVASVGLASGATAISAGHLFTCAIANGGVKCFGRGADGQLGDGTLTAEQPSPVQVSGLTSGASAVSAGVNHACAVAGGAVYCWGRTDHGALGNTNSPGTQSTPVIAGGPPPGQLGSGFTVVAAGDSFTCALRDTGRVVCFGLDDLGQLGQASGSPVSGPTPVTPVGLTSGVSAISAGQGQACAVQNGAALCWGQNSNGEIGDGSTTQASVPTPVSGLSSGVTAISAGNGFTCAVQNGGVKCWGTNTWGQLGDGTTQSSNVPVPSTAYGFTPSGISVGDSHACAYGSAGQKCWGLDTDDRLGTNTTPITPKFGLKRSGKPKVKGKVVKFKLIASAAVPPGHSAADVCKGKISVSVKPKGKKKSTTAKAKLKAKGSKCVATLNFKLPKQNKGKRLKFTIQSPASSGYSATSRKVTYKVK